jgi:YhcH/YjgK/YiaL family protein
VLNKSGKEGKVYHYFGNIADTAELEKVHSRLKIAFDFLKRDDFNSLSCGTYELETSQETGEKTVFAMIQDTDLVPFEGECQRAEAHKKYIDVQSPITGEETYGIAIIDPSDPDFDFDVEKDVGFKSMPTEPKTLQPGEFAIFMPHCGAHLPCRTLSSPHKIRKVVVKVLAD